VDDAIDWAAVPAAIWQPNRGRLRPVPEIEPVALDSLLGIERQKAELVANTRRFLAGLPANNALLWGARGTGKSTLIRALLHHFRGDGLRVLQVDRDDLVDLPDIVDAVRDRPERFIAFCDDLSFEEGERGFRALKSVLEGSIEPPPDNVRVYATSNRRHLVPEYLSDNNQARVVGDEIHPGDVTEERLSLSDRFGLTLSFYPLPRETYLAIVESLFAGRDDRPDDLAERALEFAQNRSVRSGRTARQLFNYLAGREEDSG